MTSSSVRLFTGFHVELNASLLAAVKKNRINAQQKDMELNWVSEANYHVTLNFLGNTPSERLQDLDAVLRTIAQESAPVATSLRGMGAFPDDRHMRTLWVGVRKSRGLADLQERLRDALNAAGFQQEDRDYSPHLTIAKTRKARSATDLISPYVRTKFGEVDIKAITLFESVLQNSHPIYKVVKHFELTGAPVVYDEAELSE